VCFDTWESNLSDAACRQLGKQEIQPHSIPLYHC
jgi:hypothetical protein